MERKPTPIASNVETLRELQRQRMRVAVASSSPLAFIELTLRVLGVRECIEVVESAYCLPQAKPNPEVYIRALQQLDVLSVNAVAIEDSAAGAEAAVRAGIPTLLVHPDERCGVRIAMDLQALGSRVRCVPGLSDTMIRSFAEESFIG